MILGCITQIALITTSNGFNLINENLIQALQDSQHTSSSVGAIEANNNQTLVVQNNMILDLAQVHDADTELIHIIVAENTEYHNLFVNRYSNFAVNYQLLSVNVIRRFNDIYNQYLNDPKNRQMNHSCRSQLNNVYRQYLTNLNDLYLDNKDTQAIANSIENHNDGPNIPHLNRLIPLYYDIINNLNRNSYIKHHLKSIYNQYLDALRNNQPIDVVDIQTTNEYNNQILNSLNRLFIDELNNHLVESRFNIQSMYNMCMDELIITCEQYLQDIRVHETSQVDSEFDNSNYISKSIIIYRRLLYALNNYQMKAIHEPLSRINNQYQNILYKTYSGSINDIYYCAYHQHKKFIYNRFIKIFIDGNIDNDHNDLNTFKD